MAHSPSPLPMSHSTTFINNRHVSTTPPPAQQQPLSKRDKRRSALEHRLKEISTSFSANRDLHLRNQLNSILRDITYINQANPYENKPLDDRADDLSFEPSSGSLTGFPDRDTRPFLGQHGARFINDINDALEDRDAGLTNVRRYFDKQIDYLKMEFDFSIKVAEEEERTLKEAAKSRVIATLQAKKKHIQREKDLLDTADSSTLLYNSHGFTLTQPASPGGSLNNRKTRHTRHHRQDPDSLEPLEPNKRKRKAPVDLDNDSPGPSTRNLLESRNILWDRGKNVQEHDSSQPASIDRFFSLKELAVQNKNACNRIAVDWIQNHKSSPFTNGLASGSHFRAGLGDADVEKKQKSAREDEPEQEDISSVLAPAMDRTGSHATRSTRNNALDTIYTLSLGDKTNDAHRIYGVAVADAMLIRNKIPVPLPSNKDIEAPLTSSLSTQEQTDDFTLFTRLMSGGILKSAASLTSLFLRGKRQIQREGGKNNPRIFYFTETAGRDEIDSIVCEKGRGSYEKVLDGHPSTQRCIERFANVSVDICILIEALQEYEGTQ